ncbi:MAPEG family protein [Bacteriovorax sp. DB6_IX]|uniref:MAPEG family protein n=1 Tax=Bacteriovorax sp. DB6_IX TaxID=1353530 RepID=UPI000557EC92|nr:MAPEG family protein [Bacteriovorax sp. DB6_IX]
MMTFLYASLLGVLYFLISLETINARRRNQISLGVGDNRQIEQIVSAHSNFSAYTPILLILLFGLENSEQVSPYIVHLFGLLIFFGRIFHYRAFRKEKMNFKYRVLGMRLTLWSLLVMSLVNIWAIGKIHFLN